MKLKFTLFAVLFAFASQSAFAGKTVVFNYRVAITNTDSAKGQLQALQAKPEIAKMVADFEGHNADLEGLSKERDSKGLTWSPEQQAEFRKKAEFIQADLQLLQKKIQKEQETVFQKIEQQGGKHLNAILEQIMKSDDIDLILPAESVLRANTSIDITAKVVAELNKALKK
ncbi:MAG: outer membrane protein [Flavobacteriales bacterium]|jgi:outer membrane protein